MVFYVMEIQTNEGTGSVIPQAFTDRNQAESNYHEVLKYAAVSEIDKHGAILCNEDGFIIKSEVYNHMGPVDAE